MPTNTEQEEKSLYKPDGSHDKLDDMSPAEKAESDQLLASASSSSLYKGGGKTKKQGSFWQRRKRGIIIISLFGALGGGYGGLLFLSGPFQFVHMAQLLQQFHFAKNEDAVDSRTTRIIRYIKHPDSPENRRLSAIQLKWSEKYRTRLAENGIELKTNNAGYLDELIVDPAKVDVGKFEDAGFTPRDIGDGRVAFSSEGGGIVGQRDRALIGTAMEFSGYNRVLAATHSRTLRKLYGITFSPFGLIERKTNETVAVFKQKLKDARDKYIKTGETPDPTIKRKTADENSPDAEKKDAAASNSAADEVESAKPSPDTPAGEASISETKTKLGAKTGVGIAGATVGLFCLIKGVADQADQIQYQNTVIPMMRMGFRAIANGNQVMAGEKVNMAELAEESQYFYDEGTANLNKSDKAYREKSSWSDARSIQYELGKDPTGPDIPRAAKPGGTNNILAELTAIPGAGALCDVAGSIVGTIVFGAIDFISGPGAVVAGVVSDFVIGEVAEETGIFDSVARLVAGEVLNTDASGAVFGGFANTGSRYAANSQAIGLGGRELSGPESAQLKQDLYQKRIAKEGKQPIWERLTSTENTDSFVSTVLANVPQPRELATKAASMPALFLQSFSKIPSLLSGKTQAVGSYDYGFNEFGFTQTELDDPEWDNPFENAKKVEGVNQQNLKLLQDKYGDCFGVTLTETGFTKTDVRYDKIDKTKCANPADKELTRFRIYILDSMTLQTMACYEDEESYCNDFGIGDTKNTASYATGIVGDIYESSDSVPCAEGTVDIGNVNSKYRGAKLKSDPFIIKLCQVPDIAGEGQTPEGNAIQGGAVVNSRVSGAWAALGKQAKSEGVNLSANNSFRLADSCGGTGDGTTCAKPGTSPHQLGIAIDFNMGRVLGGQTCAQRARIPSNPSWAWMFKNAEKWGIKQYSHEAWHWDLLDQENRCDSSSG